MNKGKYILQLSRLENLLLGMESTIQLAATGMTVHMLNNERNICLNKAILLRSQIRDDLITDEETIEVTIKQLQKRAYNLTYKIGQQKGW